MLCGHCVLIWIWSAGQRVRITIHGAQFSLSLSLYWISPPRFEGAHQPPTHKLSGTHTHKRGWAKARIRKLSTVYSSRHLELPVAQTFSQFSKSCPVFCSSLCLLLSQRPVLFSSMHLPIGWEQWEEVQQAPWPSLPLLPSLGIFHIRAQTSALFWLSVKSLKSRGDKGVIYLSVPGFGCLEWHIFPTLLFFFLFFSSEWKMESRCELGPWYTSKQAWLWQNRSQQNTDRGCTWKEVFVKIFACRTKSFFCNFFFPKLRQKREIW